MNNINILDLFLRTNFLIKSVILILISFSIISWAIILKRTRILNIALLETKSFEEKFWSNTELSILYKEIQWRQDILTGIEQIFYSGFKEFINLYRSNNCSSKMVVKGAVRAMRISINQELEILEKHIPLLGTIGSISPYIGLSGTVWGIMNTFISLGSATQVTLQMVAPGIAESLITTAMGLFSSIPAVIAFNYLNHRINKLELNYSNFTEEFTSVLYRQALSSDENSRRKNVQK